MYHQSLFKLYVVTCVLATTASSQDDVFSALFNIIGIGFRSKASSETGLIEPRQCSINENCVKLSTCDAARTLFLSDTINKIDKLKKLVCRIDLQKRLVSICCLDVNKKSSSSLPSSDECGNPLGNRIINGNETNPGEWPWLAALGNLSNERGFKLNCGGSLITKKHILTAAHCLKGDTTIARLGDHDITSTSDRLVHEDVKIINSIVHPNYDKISKENDIAILVMEREVTFGDYIKPICLPVNIKDTTLTSLTVVGRGVTEEGGETNPTPLKAQIDVVPLQRCQPAYSSITPRLSIDERNICARSEIMADSCQGDSGGPLHYVDYTSNIFYLVGIVSFGLRCDSAAPGVYVRVASYLTWIENNIS